MNQSFLFETDPEPVATVPGYPSVFSPCRKYRYCLWRIWRNIAAPKYALWCLCNPSTADDDDLDPTLRRCQDFSQRWDFDAMCIVNAFGFRATDPADMRAADDPCGEDNDYWIARLATDASLSIAGWGTIGAHLNRPEAIRVLFNSIGKPLHCLNINADGSPQHPLFVRADVKPKPWKFDREPVKSEEEVE